MNIKLFSFLLSIVLFSAACNSQNAEQSLDAKAFSDKIKKSPEVVILDVRTPGEFAGGFIEKAQNIDYNGPEFADKVAGLDKDKTYLVYCLSGARSAGAAGYMRSNGFKHVINLKGGILAWQADNLPIAASVPEQDKISKEAYTQMITSDTTVIVDYYAPWCAPCLKMEPMLNELAKEYQGKVKIIRLNIDENKKLASDLGIVAIPIIKKFEKGKETWTHKGYIEKTDLVKNL
ncbi:MAG: hypothetical protein RJA25_2511 [Bacteroidota bacterium]|jgi:thioredoxin